MIRINLIQAPQTEAAAKAAAPQGLPDRKEFFPLLALLISFAAVGLLYWGWNHRIASLNQQLAAERQEAVRLGVVEAQNKQYESRLAEINQHINVIRTLQTSRTGPRDFMTLLGDAADRVNGLYLLSVSAQNGRIMIHGQSDNTDAVADFIAALQGIDSFNDVELRQVFEDDQRTRVSFKFDLDCFYKPPVEMAASALPAPPSGGPGRSPGR
jgi:Tfp pilus assembly protein PilN